MATNEFDDLFNCSLDTKMDFLNEFWVKFENEKVFVQVYQVTILFCNEYILN